MSDRFDERLIRYLEGRSPPSEREELERELAGSPALAAELEQARRGLEAVRELAATPPGPTPPIARPVVERTRPGQEGARGDGRGWRRAAVIASLLLLPASGWVARGWVAPPLPTIPPAQPGAITPAANPQMREYLLLFTGPWPDISEIAPQERLEREDAYMSWIGELEAEGRWVSGNELGPDPGVFFASSGMGVSAFRPEMPADETVVGFVVFLAESTEEAERIAAACPHVRYGAGVLLKGPGIMN